MARASTPLSLLNAVLSTDARLVRVKLDGHGEHAFLPPSGPILAGYFLERTSSEGARTVVHVLLPLYQPPPFDISFTFAVWVPGLWTEDNAWDAPRAILASPSLMQHAASLETFARYVAGVASARPDPYVLRALAFTQLKLGQLELGLETLARLADQLEPDNSWQGKMKRHALNLIERGRGSDGLRALQTLLESWEDEVRASLRLPPRVS